ncbi:379_t:CDS:2, partial [Acaulospora colombiana]
WMTFAPPTVTDLEDPYAPSTRPEDKDSDDRSIDFEIDQRSSGAQRLPATGIDDVSSRPILHDILRGLVSQLDRYRQTVDGFEQYLSERRQGLMFTENLTDALNLSIELESDTSFFSAIRNTLSTPSKKTPADGTSTPPQSKSRSIGSFVPSFFTPKKTKANPTGGISVAPLVAPHVSGGTWTPPRPSPEENTVVTKITLSQLLDNVVILEEFMKEMSAIVQARRSLGIDPVRYL